LTNLATLKEWPLLVTVVDLIWGTVLTGSVALAGGGEGAVQEDVCASRQLPEDGAGERPEPHRTCGVAGARPDHHGTDNVEDAALASHGDDSSRAEASLWVPVGSAFARNRSLGE
jgi:hypothetical protein